MRGEIFGAGVKLKLKLKLTLVGAGAGDSSGSVSLWDFRNPFLPLSVVDNHGAGPVADFVWLDTPVLMKNDEDKTSGINKNKDDDGDDDSSKKMSGTDVDVEVDADEDEEGEDDRSGKSRRKKKRKKKKKKRGGGGPREAQTSLATSSVHDKGASKNSAFTTIDSRSLVIGGSDDFRANARAATELVDSAKLKYVNIWQHVCSVGRDGKVMIQSLARGLRPTMTIPSR